MTVDFNQLATAETEEGERSYCALAQIEMVAYDLTTYNSSLRLANSEATIKQMVRFYSQTCKHAHTMNSFVINQYCKQHTQANIHWT